MDQAAHGDDPCMFRRGIQRLTHEVFAFSEPEDGCLPWGAQTILFGETAEIVQLSWPEEPHLLAVDQAIQEVSVLPKEAHRGVDITRRNLNDLDLATDPLRCGRNWAIDLQG